mgnify:CR=1 FL=1
MDYFADCRILHDVAGKICFFLAALFLFSSVQAFPKPSDSTVAVIVHSKSSDSLLDKVIISRGDRQFVPFEFINDDGEPDGFTVKVFRKLMKNLGLRYEPAPYDWSVVQDQLARKERDVAIGMINSPERSRNCLFGMPCCTISFNTLDGSHDVICEKWFSHYNKYVFLEKVKPYLWGLGLFAVLAFFFIWFLNYRVAAATRNLKNENDRRNELEAELVAAKDKAERAEKLEMVFLASMSHELRTPINAIVGFSQLLQNPDATQEDRQNYMEIINANNEHVLRLISDILDLSKIESGTVEIRLSNFDAVQAFEEECAIFAPRFEALGIRFIKDNPLSEFIIRCDRGRLIQVMTNFLTNALKYTSEGSVTFGLRNEDGGLKVSVKDTGKGIAPENLKSVFEKFEKLDPSVQGTGLGLSICKAITDTFNGRIGVESNLGEGSTFWAWFPSDYRNK